jgi:hypothetical protein
MDLPQELIDSIVDAIVDGVDLRQGPWRIQYTPDLLETLKSCALVARAFVRPCQIYIFHGIDLRDDGPIQSPEALSALFEARPHLASYVRALYFEYNGIAEHLEPITHVLASLTNLSRIDIFPELNSQWKSYPAPLRAAFASAFALPCMCHITLKYICFEDASELHALLTSSTGLKTLELHSITFEKVEPIERLQQPVAVAPRVILDSLEIYYMGTAQVQAMLDSFTVVDITQLRSLSLENTSMKSLLQRNAPSIQHIKIRAYYSSALLHPPPGVR